VFNEHTVGVVAHLGTPDLDWPNPGLDRTLRSMAVPPLQCLFADR
jgi:hypothetical protein